MELSLDTPAVNDYGLIEWDESPFATAIVERCTDGLAERLSEAADCQAITLALETLGIAADAAAADMDWAILAEMITSTAQHAGVEPEVIERELARSQQLATGRPTPWILVARTFVFAAGKNQFVHISSGQSLSPEAFDLEFGCLCPDRGKSFARFLCDGRFITKVQSVREAGDCKPEFFLDRGRLHLHVPSCTCYEQPLPVLYHLNP